MRTIDHKTLAKLIIKQYMQDTPEKFTKAFYIGCIEPDYNPFSYFHGFLKSYSLYGHNFCNVKFFLDRLFNRLNKTHKHNIIYFFRLGLIVHYITDAFTHAHTAEFSGTLREHKEYEQLLHITFENVINSGTFKLSGSLLPCGSVNEISRLHDIYSNENISVYNDLVFIFSIISSIMEHFRTDILASTKIKPDILKLQIQNNHLK